MPVRPRKTELYVVAAMLVAAAGGRLLDASDLLPGVHEAVAVRGALAGWIAALLGAVLVGAIATRRWTATRRLAATTSVAMIGQVLVFFGAEAVVRLARGSGPFDPDGIAGALLQAGLAAMLLLALTVAADVALRVHPVTVPLPARARSRPEVPATDIGGRRLAALVDARGPPVVARC